MENKHKPHITKKKQRIVDELVSLMKEYPVIGIIDMTDLPALQFQRIKSKLSDKLEFKMVKKRLMKIALDKVKDKKNIEQLKERLVGIPALIFTKQDPFKLAKAIRKEVSPAPAKPGQTAPEDIVLSAGPTPFMPGPMIGELGVMGIKTKVEAGKINVVEDKVLVKKGEEINSKIADLLSKLGIEPMQIGFNLLLTYKDGEIVEKDVLFVDEKLYLETLQQYAREADSLAIYIGYVSKDTVEKLIGKAYNEAKAVSDVAKLEEKMETKVEEKKVEEQPKEETLKSEEEKKEQVPAEQKEEFKEEKPVEQPMEKEPESVEKPEEEKKEELGEEPKEETKVEEQFREEIREETPKPEEKKIEEVPVEQPKEDEVKEESELVEQPEEEFKEELKEEKFQEQPEEEIRESKIEEEPEQIEKSDEELKEEKTSEIEELEKKEEKQKEESQLKDIKDVKVGLKPVKDVTKEEIELAAKQLQEIKDKIIKRGEK